MGNGLAVIIGSRSDNSLRSRVLSILRALICFLGFRTFGEYPIKEDTLLMRVLWLRNANRAGGPTRGRARGNSIEESGRAVAEVPVHLAGDSAGIQAKPGH